MKYPLLIILSEEVHEAMTQVAFDNAQSLEETAQAAMEKVFMGVPVVSISIDPSTLDFMYCTNGKTVRDIIPGPVRSVRLEVLR